MVMRKHIVTFDFEYIGISFFGVVPQTLQHFNKTEP